MKTVGIRNGDVLKDLALKIKAISNRNRLRILVIIGKETKKPENLRKPTYVKCIAHYLSREYNEPISLTATKNHLSKLLDAGLIKTQPGFYESSLKGEKAVKNYVLIPGALEALSMDIKALNNEILTIQEEISESSYHLPIIKVLGGKDDGKIFELKKDNIRIGRKGEIESNNPEYNGDIMLSNSYKSVSRIFKPHATLKVEDKSWVIEDKESECGIFINNDKNKSTYKKLRDRDKIKLALGKDGAELLFISKP